MNRFWIGVGLLLALLGVSLWSMFAMNHAHGEISDILTQSAEAAQNGDWEQADRLVQSARGQWEDNWNLSAAMCDHTALDEIDSIFAQAEVYSQNQVTNDFAAACAQLSKLIEALKEGHTLSLWNLL